MFIKKSALRYFMLFLRIFIHYSQNILFFGLRYHCAHTVKNKKPDTTFDTTVSQTMLDHTKALGVFFCSRLVQTVSNNRPSSNRRKVMLETLKKTCIFGQTKLLLIITELLVTLWPTGLKYFKLLVYTLVTVAKKQIYIILIFL